MLKQEWVSDLEATGKKLKTLRKRAGLTQEQLAERVGGTYTNTVISRYERGSTEMGIQTMYDLAEALGVPPSELTPDRLLHNNDGIHNDNNTYKASENKSLGQQQTGTADIYSLYSQLDGPNKKMIDEMISLMLFKQKHTERLA